VHEIIASCKHVALVSTSIITGCARVLYGLHTLRSHRMPPPALHAVFQSTALAKVTYYAVPAFTNATDRNRLEAFIRRAVRHGYCADTTPTLSSLCDKADQTLFDNIITSSTQYSPSPHLTSTQNRETLLYPSPRPLLPTST